MAALSLVAADDVANCLINKELSSFVMHGVQGVASSNPAVPTSNTLRGLVMKITNPLSHCWNAMGTLLCCCRCNAVNAGV